MELRDLGALASIANTVGVSALLMWWAKLIDAGRFVRGAEYERCQRENARLRRIVERRLGRLTADELEASEDVVNGEHHEGHPSGD